MIPYFSSLGGVYCAREQAADCLSRQSSFFSFSRGTKTHWWSERKFVFIHTHTHTSCFCRTDKAYGLCEVKSAQYIYFYISLSWVYLFICLSVSSVLQGNFTASRTTVIVCLAMPRERGLLPPLLQSLLRYLFLFTSWNPGGNQACLTNNA